jgi:guanyl-specific ribonuclease Sa
MTLPPEVKTTIIEVKNALRDVPDLGRVPFRVYGNQFGGPFDGPPLPGLSAGCGYYEADVGQAHPDDPVSERGRRRLVFELDAVASIREIYYTEQHYAKGTFVRIV